MEAFWLRPNGPWSGVELDSECKCGVRFGRHKFGVPWQYPDTGCKAFTPKEEPVVQKHCENHSHYVTDCFACKAAWRKFKEAQVPGFEVPKATKIPGKPFDMGDFEPAKDDDEPPSEAGGDEALGGGSKEGGAERLKGLPVETLRQMAKDAGHEAFDGVPVDNMRKGDLREALAKAGLGGEMGEGNGKGVKADYGPQEGKPEPGGVPEPMKPMADMILKSKEFEDAVRHADVMGDVAHDVKVTAAEIETLKAKLKGMRTASAKIVVEHKEGLPVPVPDGEVPNSATLKRLIEHLSNRENVVLTGPAGSGKSTLIRLAAKALKARVYHTPCGGDIREQHLLGRTIPIKGEWTYIPAPFVLGFESKEFSINMLDEMDGVGDPSVLLPINDVLAGFDMLALPWRWEEPYAKRGEGFLGVAATMNTVGTGANAVYQGRSALDGSTLDRFVGCVIEVDYDHGYEDALVEGLAEGQAFLEKIREWRSKVQSQNLRRIISTRMVIRGAALLRRGWKLKAVYDAMLTGWSMNDLKVMGVK